MISIELSYFIITSLILIITPGPDIIFLITQSIVNGSKAGLLTALGLASGNLAHTVAAALGVSIIFQTSALAFTTLKLVGIGYLIYLAYRLLIINQSPDQISPKHFISNTSFYKRGVLLNILNPKVALFFLAYLPQFITDASTQPHIEIIILGGIFTLLVVIVFGSVSLLAVTLKNIIHINSISYIAMNRITAFIYILLAIYLALLN